MSSHEVAAVQLESIDWAAVNQYSYYTKRGDVSTETNEATVYTRRQLPFVIKTFVNPEDASKNAVTASLLEGLVPATIVARGVTVKVDNRPVTLQSCLIQERISALDSIMQGEFNKTPTRLVEVIEEKASLDREILRRGIFLNDPKFMNYGLDNEGHLKVLDVGSATDNPFDDAYMHRFLVRGTGHYFNYLALQVVYTGALAFPTLKGRELAAKYASAVGLTFDDKIGAHDFLTHEPYLFALAKDFGAALIKLALEEIERRSPFVVPQDSLLHQMAVSASRNWSIHPGGMVGYTPTAMAQ